MMQFQSPVEEREKFDHVHQFHINSLSQSSDCESILSSDDTTVNLWNLEKSLQPNPKNQASATYFNLIDKAPKKILELSEVITHC